MIEGELAGVRHEQDASEPPRRALIGEAQILGLFGDRCGEVAHDYRTGAAARTGWGP